MQPFGVILEAASMSGYVNTEARIAGDAMTIPQSVQHVAAVQARKGSKRITCELCNVTLSAKSAARHRRTSRHKRAEDLLAADIADS